MTESIQLHVEITADIANQIAGLTDLPTRIAALEQVVMCQPKAPVDAGGSSIKIGPKLDMSGLQVLRSAGCYHSYKEAVTTEAAVQALVASVSIHVARNLGGSWNALDARETAIAHLTAMRRGEIPIPELATLRDQIAELSVKLAAVEDSAKQDRSIADAAQKRASQYINERDKTLAELAAERERLEKAECLLAGAIAGGYLDTATPVALREATDAARAEHDAMKAALEKAKTILRDLMKATDGPSPLYVPEEFTRLIQNVLAEK